MNAIIIFGIITYLWFSVTLSLAALKTEDGFWSVVVWSFVICAVVMIFSAAVTSGFIFLLGIAS